MSALDSVRSALAAYVNALRALAVLRTDTDEPTAAALRSAHDRTYIRARALRRAALALTDADALAACDRLRARAVDPETSAALRPYYLRAAHVIATRADVTVRPSIARAVAESVDIPRADVLAPPPSCPLTHVRLSPAMRRRRLPDAPPCSPRTLSALRIASSPSDHALTPPDARRYFAARILPAVPRPTARATRSALRAAVPYLPPSYPALSALAA